MDTIEFDGVDIEAMSAEDLRLIIRSLAPEVKELQEQAELNRVQVQNDFDRLQASLNKVTVRADLLKKLKTKK